MEGAPDLRPSETRGRQAGRDLQGGGAEPEPVHLRRRGVGAGGRVPERQLPDLELPRPRRDLHRRRAQTGKRSRNFQFAITEPYFLDRPITAGIDVFLRRLTYLSYENFVGYTPAGPGHRPHHRASRSAASRAPSSATRTRSSTSTRSTRTPSTDLNTTAAATGSLGVPVVDSSLFGDARPPLREPGHSVLGAQHDRQPLPAPQRQPVHHELPVRGRAARGHRRLLPSQRRGRPLPALRPEDGPRPARRRGLHPPLRRHERDPVLPALLPGRREPDPRLQHPHGLARRPEDQHRPRRQQVPALQRRVLLRPLRPRPLPALLRRRARPTSRARASTGRP